MGEVVSFPVRLRVAHPITAEQAEIQDALIVSMSEGLCPHYFGRGVKIRQIHARGFFPSDFVSEPCPCGGDDENSIDLDGFDGPEAA